MSEPHGEEVPQTAQQEESAVEQTTTGTPRSCIRSQSKGPAKAARLAFSPQVEVAPDVLFEPFYVAETEGTVTRLYEEVQKREEKLRSAREVKEKSKEEELATYFKPQVSELAANKGKRYNSFDEFIQIQLKWKGLRREALDKKVALEGIIADSKRTPEESMSKITKKIVSRMDKEKRYRSPVSGWKRHFENFLLKQAGMAAPTEVSRRSSSPTHAPQHSFSPTISAYAYEKADHDSTLNIDDDHNRSNQSNSVFERLHNEHHVRKLAQKVLAESYIESTMGGTFSPSTNESARYYDPLQGDDNGSSFDGPRHPDVVVDTLLAKGQQYEEKKAHLRALKEHSKETYSFKPETNPNSKKILKAFANKSLAELEEERMSRGGKVNSGQGSSASLPDGVRGIQPPKKAAKFDVDAFTARMGRHKAIKEANLKSIYNDTQYTVAKECSFRPALTKTAVAPHARAVNRRSDGLLSGADHLSIYSSSSPLATRVRGASRDAGNGADDASIYNSPPRVHTSVQKQQSVQARLGQSTSYRQHTTPLPPAHIEKPGSPKMSHRHPQASPARGHTYSGVSSTASERHHHHGSGEDQDPTNYLANLEAEMEQVLTEWRQSADEV